MSIVLSPNTKLGGSRSGAEITTRFVRQVATSDFNFMLCVTSPYPQYQRAKNHQAKEYIKD